MELSEIRGAVARGWCHPDNQHKEMDVDLAEAISQEVLAAKDAEIKRLREAVEWFERSVKIARELRDQLDNWLREHDEGRG